VGGSAIAQHREAVGKHGVLDQNQPLRHPAMLPAAAIRVASPVASRPSMLSMNVELKARVGREALGR
jgi:hypothetical protein